MRIAVMGASVSAGFTGIAPGASPTESLAETLRSALPGAQIVDLADPMMFRRPETYTQKALQSVVEMSATAIVALDLPFWFGFGSSWYEPGDLRTLRLRKQARGLELLAQLETPLVLADYPALVGSDIGAANTPEPEVLDELNRRLRAWAAERSNVRLIGWHAMLGDRPGTLQPDGFHVTQSGIEAIATHVVANLSGLVPPSVASTEAEPAP